MKPDPRKELEKKIEAVSRRIYVLSREIRHPVSVPLETPFRRGFVRRYFLTAQAEASELRKTLNEILIEIGTERYFWNRSFQRTGWRAAFEGVEIDQGLQGILVDFRIRYPEKYPDAWFRFFCQEYWTDPNTDWRGPQWYYVFQNHGWFQLKVEPHWMTHEKILDSTAVEELDELKAWMVRHLGSDQYDRHRSRVSRGWPPYRPPPKNEARVISQSLEADTRSRIVILRFPISF